MNEPKVTLGSIRMSPLMYGSLQYIASRHQNGVLDLDEVRELKQTQLRSFKKHRWIQETANRRGITITKSGRQALRHFTENDEFFRRAANMSFTSLLNLRVPDGHDEPIRIVPGSEHKARTKRAAA